jgi:hypothetical protein
MAPVELVAKWWSGMYERLRHRVLKGFPGPLYILSFGLAGCGMEKRGHERT